MKNNDKSKECQNMSMSMKNWGRKMPECKKK